jgi:hypothetical protein
MKAYLYLRTSGDDGKDKAPAGYGCQRRRVSERVGSEVGNIAKKLHGVIAESSLLSKDG